MDERVRVYGSVKYPPLWRYLWWFYEKWEEVWLWFGRTRYRKYACRSGRHFVGWRISFVGYCQHGHDGRNQINAEMATCSYCGWVEEPFTLAADSEECARRWIAENGEYYQRMKMRWEGRVYLG